jgi:hypothetical protein
MRLGELQRYTTQGSCFRETQKKRGSNVVLLCLSGAIMAIDYFPAGTIHVSKQLVVNITEI